MSGFIVHHFSWWAYIALGGLLWFVLEFGYACAGDILEDVSQSEAARRKAGIRMLIAIGILAIGLVPLLIAASMKPR